MGNPETKILRDEVARLTTIVKKLEQTVPQMKKEHDSAMAELRAENAELKGKLAYYEN